MNPGFHSRTSQRARERDPFKKWPISNRTDLGRELSQSHSPWQISRALSSIQSVRNAMSSLDRVSGVSPSRCRFDRYVIPRLHR